MKTTNSIENLGISRTKKKKKNKINNWKKNRSK